MTRDNLIADGTALVRSAIAERLRTSGGARGEDLGYLLGRLIDAGVIVIDLDAAIRHQIGRKAEIVAEVSRQSEANPGPVPDYIPASPPIQHHARRVRGEETKDAEPVGLLYAERPESPLGGLGAYHGTYASRIFQRATAAMGGDTKVADVVADERGCCNTPWTVKRLADRMAAAPELVAMLQAVLPYARARVDDIIGEAASGTVIPGKTSVAAVAEAKVAAARIDAADALLGRLGASIRTDKE